MIIHVVQRGESTKSIAESYGISEERLILENEKKEPKRLAIGETLVILYPDRIYTVQEGDTLSGIAKKNGVTVMQLLRNNPYLSDREYIYPGETLVISYKDEKIRSVSTNGYVYPFVDLKTLKKTLPFLTYLTIYSYTVTAEGEIKDIDDKEIISMAKSYGVAPIMMLTGLAENQEEEINVIHEVLQSVEKQDSLIEAVLLILKEKGYYGVNINTPYILPPDRKLYVDFIKKFSSKFTKEGFMVLNTLSLSAFELLTGTMYDDLEYAKIGQVVDGVVLICYEWGNSIGIPSGVAHYNTIEYMLENMTKLIPGNKVFIGEPSIGFVWKLPYEEGVTKGLAVPYNTAVDIAYEYGSEIKFDNTSKTAYYQYISVDEYMVRFRDARSIEACMELIPNLGLKGNGIWNVMMFFPQMWLVINSTYEIDKVL